VTRTVVRALYRSFAGPLAALVAAHAVGTVGFRAIAGPDYSWLDCLYMTFITIATIGYGEVVDVSSPAGRIFTMLVGASGIAIVYYMLAKMTMFLVAGELNVALRRRKMLKQIESLAGHYIVCGIGRVGSNVAQELAETDRPYVAVDVNQHRIDEHRERRPDALYVHGDGGEDEVLRQAGVARAAGVFAITGDDSRNLVITLSAKQLNPAVRVVARCHEINYVEKMRMVGADAVVSPDFTGGMRMASSMVRPHVVSFLDEMLRADGGLRVEEMELPPTFPGGRIGALGLRGPDYVLLAVRAGQKWIFNPGDELELAPGNALVFMSNPQARKALQRRLAG
jgi:voltage-gated potassium channel